MTTTIVTYHLSDLLIELTRIFKLLNGKFFKGSLELPVIVVQSHRRKRTLGTCSVNRIWVHKELPDEDFKTRVPNAKHEITISAEYLNRPVEEICATLLHEMVHLYNGLNNIKDTSNNYVYHNKRFKKEAEERGLIIEHAPTIGWSVTTLKPETKEMIKGFNINKKLFEYYRMGAAPEVAPKIRVKLTKEEKLKKLYERLDKLQEKIEAVKASNE